MPGPMDPGYTAYDIDFIDLNLSYGGPFIVQWMDFINAPFWGVDLKGNGSSISVSNFGQGGYGIGPSGGSTPGTETEKQSATRHSAIYLAGANNGAWYNNIAYTGDGAINMNGTGQYFYGNLLAQSRYEMPNGQGGQVFVSPSSSGTVVAGNVIDGTPGWDGVSILDLWTTTSSTMLDTGCSPRPDDQYPSGIEAYGSGQFFYNNEAENNSGGGMGFGGSNPTNDITISSWNPYDPSDTPRYIENNGWAGILFLGPYTLGNCPLSPGVLGYLDSHSVCQPIIAVHGVTLDNVLVRRNAGYGVRLDGVSEDSTNTNPVPGGYFTGFIHNACIYDTTTGYFETAYSIVPLDLSNPPANPTPANDALWFQRTTTDPNSGLMTTCPASSGPAEPTPARSNIPGWRW
jgi:hypothetical protein